MVNTAPIVTRASGHGKGCAVLRGLADEAILEELSYRYPLKLLSPRTHSVSDGIPTSIVYMLSYGGGLVSGDVIELDVSVGKGTALMLLTQGSTKVFKSRSQNIQAALGIKSATTKPSVASNRTHQRMSTQVEPSGFLLLLPDPITCFASSSYSQSQTFRLAEGASGIVLDWFTSGRMARGEEWAFERYRSLNEFWVGSKRIARDVMLLEDPASHSAIPSPGPTPRNADPSSPSTQEDSVASSPSKPTSSQHRGTLPLRSLKSRLAPYACYATLFLIGPQVEPIITLLASRYDTISQMQAAQPDALLWSMSPLNIPLSGSNDQGTPTSHGAIVRLMGMETELVRNWVKEALHPLEASIGTDALRAAFI